MPPKLSVVVPFYGVEQYIGECLTSIAAQTLDDLEVILVDDESLDGSRRVADEFAERDPRFRVVARPNGGLGPARNTGAEHANGEYLAFIDSDDIVAPFAFEHLVGALDVSGSSFAAGNARRFNNTLGSRPSWTHRQPFAHTRLGTHIMEVPALARDRMVWNKVYRHSFWNEHGFEFPAIRYEDYPVTFPAHLKASSVDVLAETVYFWRERESGDSITQNAYQFDNLRDRVTSAMMVLDAAESTTPQVRRVLHHALAEADFLTLAQGFAQVPQEDVERLRALTLGLADRIGSGTIRKRHHYDYLQYRAIRLGDVDLAADLARFRAGGGLDGALRAERPRHPGGAWHFPYPGRGRRGMPKAPYRAGRHLVRLRPAVNRLTVGARGITFVGTADIRHVPTTPDSTLTARIGTTDRWVALPLTRFDDVDSHGTDAYVGFELTVSPEVVRSFIGAGTGLRIELTMSQAGTTRSTVLHGGREGSPRWCERLDLGEGHEALVTFGTGGHYAVILEPASHRLVGAAVVGDVLELAILGRGLPDATDFLLAGWSGQPDFMVPVAGEPEADGAWRYRLGIPLVELSRGRAAFDPFQEQRARPMSFVLPVDQATHDRLRARAEGTATVARPEDDGLEARVRRRLDADGAVETVHELHWSVSWGLPAATQRFGTADGEVITLTRTRGGMALVTTGRPRATVDRIDLREEPGAQTVEVSGPVDSILEGQTLAWTQFHPASNDPVYAPGEFTVGEGRWRLRTALGVLLGVEVQHPEEAVAGMQLSDWSLLCTEDGEVRTSAMIDPFANTVLPATHDAHGRRLVLSPLNGILHATVRQHHAVQDTYPGGL